MAFELSKDLIYEAAREMFTVDYFVKTDRETVIEEALGILTARLFEWDGTAVLRVCASGLEDSNYHTESGFITDAMLPLCDDEDAHAVFYEEMEGRSWPKPS
jgi:hypothetical protein